MRQPKNFDKIEDSSYLINGKYFEMHLATSLNDGEYGIGTTDSVVWMETYSHPKIACFIFKWDATTSNTGCRVELRFCKKLAGFHSDTTMKLYIASAGFKTPDSLRNHIAWMVTKYWSFLSN